jgi:hypothetical protein
MSQTGFKEGEASETEQLRVVRQPHHDDMGVRKDGNTSKCETRQSFCTSADGKKERQGIWSQTEEITATAKGSESVSKIESERTNRFSSCRSDQDRQIGRKKSTP